MIGQDKLLYFISEKLGDMLRIISWHHLKFTVRDWRDYLHHHLTCCHLSCSQIGGTTVSESSADRLTSEVYSKRLEGLPESSADRLSSEVYSQGLEGLPESSAGRLSPEVYSQRLEGYLNHQLAGFFLKVTVRYWRDIWIISWQDFFWMSLSELGETTWIISWQADIWSSESEFGGTAWIISWQADIWSSQSEIGGISESSAGRIFSECHCQSWERLPE